MSLSNGGGWFNGFTTDRFLPRVHPPAAHPILPILASQEIPTSYHGYSVNHERKGDTSTPNVFLNLSPEISVDRAEHNPQSSLLIPPIRRD
jgi:hypothetical protein